MIRRVPAKLSKSAKLSSKTAGFWLFRLQNIAVKDRNQINTDKSTCTTSAVWKKSIQGMNSEIVGVRDNTSNKEKIPEVNNAKIARKNHSLDMRSCDGVNWSRL